MEKQAQREAEWKDNEKQCSEEERKDKLLWTWFGAKEQGKYQGRKTSCSEKVMTRAEIDEVWQKVGAFQQRRTSWNVFKEEKQGVSHSDRSRRRSRSGEKMDATLDKLVEEYEEQEKTASRQKSNTKTAKKGRKP